MSDIYVFSSNEDNNDYSTMGLVGALEPTECKFEETANGDSLVTMTHPIDEFGKYTALVRDNILVIPVPVRTTPEIQNGSCVTTVWTYKVKPLNQLTSKNQRTLYKSSSGSGKRKVMNAGDIVTVVYQPKDTANISRWKVKSKYGTGWIDPNGFELITEHKIEDNANAIQEVQSPWMITDQLFRIYEVERGLEKVTVSARHITYDLLYDATHYYYGSDQAVSLQTTLDNILGKSYGFQTRFHAYTNVTNTQTGLSFRGKNEIECFLDPEDGVCAKFDVDMIRDNYDLYFLHDPGINRGVRIQYGKNLTGISYKDNTEELVTRIIPTGETKNGEEFFLAGPVEQQCVDSKYINDYPIIHVYYMKCENCKIGDKDENGGKITEAVARARMRAQAQKMFDSGCDLPKIEMSVEFINLGDTEEYKQFRNLENCFLYDYVIIQHPKMNIDVTAQIVKMEWDCLLDRMNSVEIGTVGKTLANTGITSWQIPSGFSGAKIAQETIGSAALRSDIVAAKHIQSDTISANHIQANAVTAGKIAAGAITTDKLDAGSVTAEKIAANAIESTKIKAGSITTDKLDAGSVTAEKIAANAVEADKIKAGAVTANKISANAVTAEKISAEAITSDKIKAGAVTTGKLAAGAVTAETIASGTITADRIKTKTITADSGIIDDSAIGTAQIADGSITSAKIVELNADLIKTGTLSAERLLLVGDDGVIYKINAASSGLSMTELAKDQYKNYINGTVIVAKSITAAQIAAQTITGNEILAGSITAKEINVSDLFASSATINALNAMDITGNTYLKLYVTEAVDEVSVGGTNLYRGTRDFVSDPSQPWENLALWTVDGTYGGLAVAKFNSWWNGLGQTIAAAQGETYTFSAYLKKDDGMTGNVQFFAAVGGDESASVTNNGAVISGITDTWQRFNVTFAVVASGKIQPRLEKTAHDENAYLYLCGMKLEKGNKATDWSPAPEDPAGSLSVSSEYSKVDINKDRVRIVSKQMEVAVPSDDGEDDVLRVDADGVHAEVVEADQIVSGSVVHTQAAESYTPANAGELAAYLEGLSGKCLTGDVDVNCVNVSSGSFEVQGLCGAAGKLTLRNGAMNALTVRGCGRNVIVRVESMAFSTSGVAVTVDDGAVMLSECSLNAGTGLRLGANWPSEAWLSDCEGDCTTLAALSSFSRLWASGSKPTGTLTLAAGSEVYNATSDPTFAAKPDPSIPTTQTVTVSLSPTNTYTLRGTSNSDGNKLYQGRYSSSQPLRKGVMLFALPGDLAAADSIDAATLTIKRIGGVGQGGGVPVQVRCFDQTGTLYASKTAYEGQTVTIDVTSAVKAMKSGGYTGLMLYNPDTTTAGSKSYTASYARFAGKGEAGAPVLKISYRK